MSVAGPYFLRVAWWEWLRRVEGSSDLGVACKRALLDSVALLPFTVFQRRIATHHWSGTWHRSWHDPSPSSPRTNQKGKVDQWNKSFAKGVVGYNPHFLKWFGVNRSLNCPEASFDDLIRRTWTCKTMGRELCARLYWADYLNDTYCDDEAHKASYTCRGGSRRAKERRWAEGALLAPRR